MDHNFTFNSLENEQISFTIDPEGLETFGVEETNTPEQDGEHTPDRKRVKKTRTQGLSMSDIPNNVFQGEQINSYIQESDEEQPQEPINFGLGSTKKIHIEQQEVPEIVEPIEDIDQDFLNNLLSNPTTAHENLYGEDQNNDVNYIVSPMKDSTYEPKFPHSPEQKIKFDEVKSNTWEFKDVIKSEQQISAREGEKAGLTERVNYGPIMKERNSHLQVPNFNHLTSRNKENDHGFLTQRDTHKSESSYMPPISKYDNEEETEFGKYSSW